MSLGWVVAPVYFIRDVGMSPLELVLAGTALEVAYTLFEVPTSVVADTFSRRVSVVVAQVVMGVAFGFGRRQIVMNGISAGCPAGGGVLGRM